MPLPNPYSRRLTLAAKVGEPDVYRYDDLSPTFRVQVLHIWRRLATPDASGWVHVEMAVAEAHGLLRLPGEVWESSAARCSRYLCDSRWDQALDLIEISIGYFEGLPDFGDEEQYGAPEAIADLNERFQEHAIGYQYVNGEILRVDSEFLHAEAVKPALTLLRDAAFGGPEQEFLKAHEHYRAGRRKEAIIEAAKAFESTLKTICMARGWAFNADKDTAKALLDIVFHHELIPKHLQDSFTGLRSVLANAVPATRNRMGAHGQGSDPVAVPSYLAAYVLHVAASNIVLLVEAHNEKP